MIEVLPSKNEVYSEPAMDVLQKVRRNDIRAGEGEAVMMAVCGKEGRVQLGGTGTREQMLAIAFSLISEVAGVHFGEKSSKKE